MRRRAAALLVVALALSGAPAAAADDIPAGYLDGREHEVRIRRVLAELPPQKAKLKRSERARGRAAVATCDPAQVEPLRGRTPTSKRADDERGTCVIVAKSARKRSERLLLGPATFTGSELGPLRLRSATRGRRRVMVQLSTRGEGKWVFLRPELGDEEFAVTLDARLVDLAPIDDASPSGSDHSSLLLGGKRGFERPRAEELRGLFEEAESEEVIELARVASLNRRGRKLFAGTDPVIREKADFGDDCPLPEADDTFVLGCYDDFTNKIAVIRVERLDLFGVMPVTAAHELLHAAYAGLDR